jgi:hypothetical protein
MYPVGKEPVSVSPTISHVMLAKHEMPNAPYIAPGRCWTVHVVPPFTVFSTSGVDTPAAAT